MGAPPEIAEEDDQEAERCPYIPHDLLTYRILIKLPIKSLIRFKSVSKLWYATISSSSFAITHFKSRPFSLSNSPIHCLFIQSGHNCYCLSYDDRDRHNDDDDIVSYYGRKGLLQLDCDFEKEFEKLYLVGSCNGLVCFKSSSGFFIIWNPTTHQFRKISDPCLVNCSKRWPLSWGFGYVSSVDDYKIVRIIEMPNTVEILVHVFSLKSNEWRRIDPQLYQHLFSLGKVASSMSYANTSLQSFKTHRGVLVNETLYWIAANIGSLERNIVSFELAHEIFDQYPYLKLTATYVYRDNFLCVMGGCLSTCGVNMRDDVYITTSKSPGKQESIRLSRDMRLVSCQDVVGFTTTGKVFVIGRYSKELGLVDPGSSPKKYTPLVTFERGCGLDIVNIVPSLISPFAIGQSPEE